MGMTTTIVDQWTGRVRWVKDTHPEARKNARRSTVIEELTYHIALKLCPACKGTGFLHLRSVTPDVPGLAAWGEDVVCPECGGEGNAVGKLEEDCLEEDCSVTSSPTPESE